MVRLTEERRTDSIVNKKERSSFAGGKFESEAGKASKARLHSPLNLEELQDDKAARFAIDVANTFSVLEALKGGKTPEDLWKNTKEILLEVAR